LVGFFILRSFANILLLLLPLLAVAQLPYLFGFTSVFSFNSSTRFIQYDFGLNNFQSFNTDSISLYDPKSPARLPLYPINKFLLWLII